MSDIKLVNKKLINTRLLKNYGGWIYCNTCGNTVGYLCYSTYDYFKLQFVCNCGEHGSIEIGEYDNTDSIESQERSPGTEGLIVKKGRLCCPGDQSPLFSIVNKNLKQCDYHVICKECTGEFRGSK